MTHTSKPVDYGANRVMQGACNEKETIISFEQKKTDFAVLLTLPTLELNLRRVV